MKNDETVYHIAVQKLQECTDQNKPKTDTWYTNFSKTFYVTK